MGIEIERKFLVKDTGFLEAYSGEFLAQGYLSAEPKRTVRVRIKGEKAWLTIKGKNEGIKRSEFEYEIPISDAQELIKMCKGEIVEKIRYKIEVDGYIWEVDKFLGKNDGLILAEIELSDENENPSLPSWVSEEVSSDSRYFNSYLFLHPYTAWSDKKE